MLKKLSPPKPTVVRNQKGQSFLEFILVLLIMMTVSFAFLKGFRGFIGQRWEIMLTIISKPESKFNLP